MARVKMDIVCTECGSTFTHLRYHFHNRTEADKYEQWATENITI